MQALCMMPNADAGSDRIRTILQEASVDSNIRLVTHLPRSTFVSWLAAADLLVGNSSSGIIEAASFGLPVVNIGSRQFARERSGNVIDCRPEMGAIRVAIRQAAALRGMQFQNVYGDGLAGQSIVELLATLPLNAELLNKMNAY